MSDTPFDAVIIGSGAGGLTAAARLSLAGLRPLVLEAQDRPGGRFSSVKKDGCVFATGAIAIESPGPWLKVMDDMGVDHGVVQPEVPLFMRMGKMDIRAGSKTWEFLIKNVTKAAAGMADAMRSGGDPTADDISLRDWALKYTRNDTILGFIDNVAQQTFIVNAHEISAGTFFRFLRETGAHKSYGFAPRGNLELVEKLIDRLRQRGAQVRLGWKVRSIDMEDQQVCAVRAVGPEGLEIRIPTRAVISNAGPVNTARMLAGTSAGAQFARRVERIKWASITNFGVLSDVELVPKAPGMIGFVGAGPRLHICGNMSAVCPELAPPGKYLYHFYSVPSPSLGHTIDPDLEYRLLDEDLRRHFKDYANHARVVHVSYLSGPDAPGMHAGPDLSVTESTPVVNLFEVGDGVKLDGGGTSACAKSAERAVSILLRDVFAVTV
jgi:phytoene desaturase